MGDADRERWDARWAGRAAAEPLAPDVLIAAGLVDIVPTSGRALDVACGLGAQAVWLARRGLSVMAIDVSAEAVATTTRLATAFDVGASVDARRFDLDAGLPDDATDLEVIVCQRFRGIGLYPEFVERLRVGGLLVLTVLSEVGAESPGPFHAPPGELAEAFSPLAVDVVHQIEADGQSSIVARRS